MHDYIQSHRIRAKKSLGQNFLVEEQFLDTIVQASEILDQRIIEVGPGYGALTEKIMARNPSILELIELDRDMVEILEERKQDGSLGPQSGDIIIHHLDVLKFQTTQAGYHVIANIPYYITSPILFHFLYEIDFAPTSMIILMQKDVADKILAATRAKKPKSSVLSMFLLKKTNISHICDVPASAFEPAPKVESSVLKFDVHTKFSDIDDAKFMNFVKIAFSEPRKKLIKNLSKSHFSFDVITSILIGMGIDQNTRAEDLCLENWIELFQKLHS